MGTYIFKQSSPAGKDLFCSSPLAHADLTSCNKIHCGRDKKWVIPEGSSFRDWLRWRRYTAKTCSCIDLSPWQQPCHEYFSCCRTKGGSPCRLVHNGHSALRQASAQWVSRQLWQKGQNHVTSHWLYTPLDTPHHPGAQKSQQRPRLQRPAVCAYPWATHTSERFQGTNSSSAAPVEQWLRHYSNPC